MGDEVSDEAEEGSERLVRIELGHAAVGHELTAPSLLDLGSVDVPQRMAHGVQAFKDSQRLLGCPVARHEKRWLRWGAAHGAALRERDGAAKALRWALRTASRSCASLAR